jgi:hypothetical protein
LHYIGDLTQPYHAQPLPGVSTPQALWKLIKGETEQAIQLVSNRHGVLESYQYQRVMQAQRLFAWQQPILARMVDAAPGPDYSSTMIREQLTAESVAAGAGLDAALEQHMPAQFVDDPTFEWTGSGQEAAIVDRVRSASGASAIAALDEIVAEQLARFGRYARSWIAEAEGLDAGITD